MTLTGDPAGAVTSSGEWYSNTILASLFHEALALVGDGIDPSQVESAADALRMPVPPLAALDLVSLKPLDDALHRSMSHERHDHDHGSHDHDHGHGHGHDHASHPHAPGHDHSHEQAHSHDCGHDHAHNHDDRHGHDHGHDHDHDHDHAHDHDHDHDHDHAHNHDHAKAKAAPVAVPGIPESAVYVLEKMAHGFDRMGKDFGGGFYDYDDDGSKALWVGLRAFKRRVKDVTDEDVRDRLLYAQALAAVRQRSADPHQAKPVGWGFDDGNPLTFINRVGLATFCARADNLASRFGDRFAPPALLREHQAQAKPF